MNWYVLHVLTGAELESQRHLIGKGVDAVVLRETVMIRRGGRWQEEIRILFPGYVFVFMKYTASMFYLIKETPGSIRLLPKDRPMPMLPQDCAWLLMFAGEDILPVSKVDFSMTEPKIVSGALETLKEYIVKYDRHRRKVLLRVPVLGECKEITLSILPV